MYMDRFSNLGYNIRKDDIGVIKMSTIPTTIEKPKTTPVPQKITTFKELRKKVAIKTASNHSLRELYKRG